MRGPKRDWIAADLRRLIAATAPGTELPGQFDLMARYQVARETVRNAYALIESEGLTDRGLRGRPVVRARVVTIEIQAGAAGESAQWQAHVARAGRRAAPPRIEVRHEAGSVIRDELWLLDGRPHNWARWTFPRDVADGTRLDDDPDIPEGSIPYLEALGWDLQHEPVAYEPRMPTPDETTTLQLPGGTPVLAEFRTVRAERAGLVRTVRAVRVLRGDQTRLIVP
jgi:GntR family transcriptional regulator